MCEEQYRDLAPVMDVGEVAQVLGCGQTIVRSLISSGTLGHVRLGRLIRIPRHTLLAFLEVGAHSDLQSPSAPSRLTEAEESVR